MSMKSQLLLFKMQEMNAVSLDFMDDDNTHSTFHLKTWKLRQQVEKDLVFAQKQN